MVQAYIIGFLVGLLVGSIFWGPEWSSTDEIQDPAQNRGISGIRTRKYVGENQEAKPKTADPKPADIRPEPDPLPFLFAALMGFLVYRMSQAECGAKEQADAPIEPCCCGMMCQHMIGGLHGASLQPAFIPAGEQPREEDSPHTAPPCSCAASRL